MELRTLSDTLKIGDVRGFWRWWSEIDSKSDSGEIKSDFHK
jgi:hypothetical protein